VSEVPAGDRPQLLEKIDKSHIAWCCCEDWTKDGGRFQKGLEAWLNPKAKRWEAEAPKFDVEREDGW